MDGSQQLFQEPSGAGNQFRSRQLEEIEALISDRRKVADLRRREYFRPDFSSLSAYEESTASFRADFTQMLGWPLNEYHSDLPTPEAQVDYVGEDDLGKIYRVHITALPGVTTYGLLFVPPTKPPFPLVISQHGGLGTPELCSGFFGSDNYNDMTRRVLRRGVAVFAPQLLLWGEQFGPTFDRAQIDYRLKQLGGSVTALEVMKLRRSLDYLVARTDIDGNRAGMIGLSYGGFYTQVTAAVELRIKVALSSGYLNDRYRYAGPDMVWFNAANQFLDAEICGLICPRHLYIEVGLNDELFAVESARSEYERVQDYYARLGLQNRLVYREFEGVHELDKSDQGIDFLCSHL